MRPRNNKIVRDSIILKNIDRITGDYNDFWESRNYRNQTKNIKAAVLMSHGFNDWNVMPNHSYSIYKAIKTQVPAQIFYHQAGHGGPPPMKMMNRWFTRYLHNIQNNVEEDARAWIVREQDKRDAPTAYADYPNPAAQPVTLYLNRGAPAQGTLSLKKAKAQGTETLNDNFSFTSSALAQAEFTDHRLIYLSPILTKDVHISGVARLKIRMASSKEAVNLSAYLISLPWKKGHKAKVTDNLITRGWADPQNHASKTIATPKNGQKLQKGKFYEFSFNLQPDDQIIKAGQQIALMIIASDKGFTLQPKPGTKLSVDLDQTEITIPIVGGKAEFIKAVTKKQ